MKKALLIAAVAALFIGGLVFAQTTVTNRGDVITVNTMADLPESTETTVYPDARYQDLAVDGTLQVSDSDVVTEATLYQADTNVTTTITGHTPDFIGQMLIGGAGTGTNAVWISKGVTTNDWVQVAP